jgi:hypothetical protein
MKKIVDYGEYIKEFIKFPYGGKIGGEHKKPISDKDIDSGHSIMRDLPHPNNISKDAYDIEREKNDERKINLMGETLNDYGESEMIKRLIDAIKFYLNGLDNYYFGSIKNTIENLPTNVIKHFNIDITSDEGIKDFIENKFELFKRSFEMWKEIETTYPGKRYGM